MRTVTLLMLLLVTGTSEARGDPITADQTRELPVETLQQAVATKASMVAGGGELHLSCAPIVPGVSLVVGAYRHSQVYSCGPVPILEPRWGSAMDAVVWMLDAFERRSYADYTAWLAADYQFQSTDSTLRARHPRGMSLEDELAFARGLFRDPAVESSDLPYATRIRLTRRLIRAVDAPKASSVWIIIEGLRAQIDLSDGSEFDTGEARHELQMVRTAEGWRVRRWNEIGEGAEPTAETPVAAAQTAESMATAPATSLSLPARLDVYAVTRLGGGVPMLALALPRRGGRLEMFDIQGRRWFQRDLGDLPAGYHRVSLDGGPYPSGVYWARVRQASESATTTVVWAR